MGICKTFYNVMSIKIFFDICNAVDTCYIKLFKYKLQY